MQVFGSETGEDGTQNLAFRLDSNPYHKWPDLVLLRFVLAILAAQIQTAHSGHCYVTWGKRNRFPLAQVAPQPVPDFGLPIPAWG